MPAHGIYGSAFGIAGAALYRREKWRRYRARDVVAFLVRSRPRISLTPGTGLPRGRSLLLRARGLDSSACPRLPGRYRLAGWQVQGKAEVRDARKR
jgi:hypothetical protein